MGIDRTAFPCRQLPAHRRPEHGVVLILVALLALVLIAFVGLALDSAHVNASSERLQDAADGAALAAARCLKADIDPFTTTRTAAVNIAAANNVAGSPVQLSSNSANAADGDIVVGTWNAASNTFTPGVTSPNAVKVTARRTASSSGGALGLVFGPAFGVASSDVSRTAIALRQGSPNPYLLILNPTASASLSMTGNGNINTAPGKVQVNSNHANAIKLTGSTALAAGTITTAGGASYPSGSITGTVVLHGSTVADPLANVLPDTAAWNALKSSMVQPLGATGKISSAGTYSPGYYPKGLDITSTTSVTLSPGSYMFGTKFNEGGSSTVTGNGVTIFLDSGANLGMAGGTNLILKPPSSGTYQGLTLFSHRANTGASAVSLNGGGTVDIEGTVYVPGGKINMTGTTSQNVGGLICDKFDMTGVGVVTGKNVVPPASPSAVFLVH